MNKGMCRVERGVCHGCQGREGGDGGGGHRGDGGASGSGRERVGGGGGGLARLELPSTPAPAGSRTGGRGGEGEATVKGWARTARASRIHPAGAGGRCAREAGCEGGARAPPTSFSPPLPRLDRDEVVGLRVRGRGGGPDPAARRVWPCAETGLALAAAPAPARARNGRQACLGQARKRGARTRAGALFSRIRSGAGLRQRLRSPARGGAT